MKALVAANKDWNDTHDLAKNLQANGTIPVKKEDKTGDTTRIAFGHC
ncbi:hypothetical protein [Brevibacillus laterosporus]|nr:hypothetical protein [Brevibacillus laterosporus]MDN9011211.1 hypothetical protein [Brevibacillus laterosporus]MDO0942234.1 hypothetical protein [Brevibacillus laterosporus]